MSRWFVFASFVVTGVPIQWVAFHNGRSLNDCAALLAMGLLMAGGALFAHWAACWAGRIDHE